MNAISATPRGRLSTIATLTLALACPASMVSSADLSAGRGVEASGTGTYDALLSEPGAMCSPTVAGRPPLLQNLILAQTETKPFKPQPMKAAANEFRNVPFACGFCNRKETLYRKCENN